MRAAGKPPRSARVRSITKIQTAVTGSLAEARQRPMVVQRFDLFRERLRALESRVELAVIESGAVESSSRITDALEALLDGYARIARGLEEGSLAGLVRRLRSRAHVAGVDDFGYDREFEQVVAPLFRALYRTWWRVETRGIEHVRASGRVLMVANHAGGMFAYDGAMLKVALLDEHPAHREVRPLVDDFVYNLPYVGTFMTRCGGVRASPENADRLLKRDEAVVVFPEGTKGIGKAYRDRYRLARFGRGGFVRIALRTGAPVVPVAIVGSEEIHPIIGRWEWLARLLGLPYFPLTPTFPWLGVFGLLPLPSKWRIEFGRPLDWSDRYGPEAAKDRLLVSRLTEEVRQQVQRLLAEAIERRGPAFF